MDLKTLFTPFPVLTTPRLLLRALHPADLNDLFEYASDAEIDRFTPWEHYASLQEAQADLDRYLKQYETSGFGVWGIEHQADQKLIGITNFGMVQREDLRAEMGYTIARQYWGQGYATEAVRAVIQFGFERMGLVRIEAVVLPENLASSKVIRKAGMQFEGLLRKYQVWKGQPSDLEMYAIVKDQVEAIR